MTELFRDNFDGVLSATNYSESSGAVWSVPSAGTAGFLRGTNAGFQWIITTTTAHAAVADTKVSTNRVANVTQEAGIVARFSGTLGSSETCYYLDSYASGTHDLFQRVAGVQTFLDTRSGSFAAGDKVSLTVSGSGATVTLKIFVNDVQVGTAITDSSAGRITGAGQTGLVIFEPGTFDFDQFVVEDLPAGGTTTQKTMTDTLTASDAAIRFARRVRQMADTVVVTDSTTQWRRLKRVMDETLTLADSVVKTLILAGSTTYTKVMSDTLAVTDAVVQWLRRVRGPIDTVTLSDGDTYRTSIVTADETIDLTDGFVSWRRLVRVAQDNIVLIDGFSKSLGGAGIVYAKVMSDVAILVDDAGQRWKLRVSQATDAIGLSDQVLDYLRAVRSLGDVVELVDGTVKVRRTIKSMDESIQISDDKVSTLYLDQVSNTSFSFGSSGPPFRFGGM